MKAVIVSGGKAPSKESLMKITKDANLIIGADKGCQVLWENNIIPNIIVGDFDSIDKKMYERYRCKSKEYKFIPEKDYTDSDIAFNKAVEMGCSTIILLGCTGTRLDHVLANLGLLKKALDLNIHCEIVDENNRIFLINKEKTFHGKKGDTISFLAYFSKVKKLNILNSKYNLKDYDLEIGDSLTVSNEFIGEELKVFFESGILLVDLSKD